MGGFRCYATRFAAIALPLGFALATTVPAAATPVCSDSTNCTLLFTATNSGSGLPALPPSGNYGQVNLSLAAGVVTITVNLTGFHIVNTGFPNGNSTSYAIGFNGLGGGLTLAGTGGNYSSNAIHGVTYSGLASHSSQDFQFDGFGNFNNAAATETPSTAKSDAGSWLSFEVKSSTATAISDVNQLVAASTLQNGKAGPNFVVDVWDASGATGLLAAYDQTGTLGPPSNQNIAEPPSMALLAFGLFGLALVRARPSRQRVHPLHVRR